MLAMLVLGVLSSFEAVQNFGSAFLHLETAEESTNRLSSILDKPTSDESEEKPEKIPRNLDIVFKDVSFSYPENPTTLDGISFGISQGSKTAIVGTSGSGKSTLINLLLRFWETEQGLITLGNKELSCFKKEQLASVVNVVLQDSYIFNRSVRENLLLANPEATDSRLMEVLKAVGLSFFAQHLDQEMGTHGMKLSGGERQLFSIARAFLKDAPVWVIDEPSANLDVDTEQKIFGFLFSALHDKTVIFITHRMINMDRMDQILVMRQGVIIERGTHHQLISADTHYRNMHELQEELLKD
jgi:ATP-binding cassette, subfamily C, bacterial CydC